MIRVMIRVRVKSNNSNSNGNNSNDSNDSNSNIIDELPKQKNTFLQYTGKSGLEKVMDFKKKSSYNISFSYKKDVLNKYGRIFSKEKIGNYSGKIKSIIENINNSDGIIMVYSQFLEGSLIPLALALEEEGYERSDVSNASNMFSDTETKAIKSNKIRKTAKYAFISGNSIYSPNNSKELSKITSDDNKNGEQIKIVLISRAGSEGLDFKNIRQLHILEPWYNTKRIEQIIGRGVRNCSHKSLPFEKRNVSIFLHATNPFIKIKDSNEEPADLYVYRYAERGAVKIGIVSRIAKETSIDCLINSNMTEFDADKLNLNVKILLSNKNQINYQVGDKPYTSTCDYMEKCSYSCRKADYEIYNLDELKKIESKYEKDELLEPSFYENDISHLIVKISSLYLENYVFSINDIYMRLKGYAGKPYSMNHITAALVEMTGNKNIKIIDNFGRYGTLVKIGEFYFFNPSETVLIPNDYFEIKTPVEYKHKSLLFKQPKRVKIAREKKITKGNDVEYTYLTEIKEFLNKIMDKIDIGFDKPEKIKNDKDWYRLSAFAIPELIKMENIGINTIKKIIIHHIIDFEMTFSMKKKVIELIYKNTENLNNFESSLNTELKKIFNIVKDYLVNASVLEHINDKNRYLFGLFDDDYVFNYFIINNEGLEIAKPEDINDFKNTIIEHQKKIIKIMAQYIGFISVFKQNRLTFKVKYMKQQRSKGARCDQAGKTNSISLIRDFRDENINGVETNNNVVKTLNKMITNAICVYQELLLRYYNEINHKNKIWFLSLEQYKQTNVEKITL